MIKFKCDSCGKKIGVKDEYAGKRVKCPGCSEPIRIPEAEAPHPSEGDGVDALAALAGGATGGLQSVEAEAPADKSGAVARGDEGGGAKACPGCGAMANPSAKICVECGAGFGGISAKNRVRAQKTAWFAGRSGVAVVGGLAAALVAGGIWAGVARYTGFEVGFLAWFLGIFVGFIVAVIAQNQNDWVGIASAFVALLGWAAGKLMILYWALPIIAAGEMMDLAGGFGIDANEELGRAMAVDEMLKDGTLSEGYLEEMESEELTEADYARYEAEMDQKIDEWIASNGAPDPEVMMVETIREEIMSQPLSENIWEVVDFFDVIWVFLMLGSAWKVGSGVGIGGD